MQGRSYVEAQAGNYLPISAIAARASGGALKLPQRVWVEPGRQMHLGSLENTSTDVFGSFM